MNNIVFFENFEFFLIFIAIVIISFLILVFRSIKSIDNKSEKRKESYFEEVKKAFCINYFEKEFETEEKREWCRGDCESFLSYDLAVETENDSFTEYDAQCENIARTTRKEDSKDIDMYLYEYISYTEEYQLKRTVYTEWLNFAIITEISSKKRLHVHVNDEFINNKKIEDFSKIFTDKIEYIKKFDKEHIDYCWNYTNYYNNEEFKNDGNYEYLELSEKQKEFLLSIYKNTNLRFSLVLENGVLRVNVRLKESGFEDNNVERKIVEIFIKLLNEFKNV